MIQLKKSGVVIDQCDVERLRNEFEKKHCVLLPKLVEETLLSFLLLRTHEGRWEDKVHEGIGCEIILDDRPALHLLHFLTNVPSFINAVRTITGCDDVGLFAGRVYRFNPDPAHYDTWHDDLTFGRRAALSLNLSPEVYEGGIFELRRRQSKEILARIANTGLGDATLFRIDNELEHQVTTVTGSVSKTAFAGWFRSGVGDLLSQIRQPAP